LSSLANRFVRFRRKLEPFDSPQLDELAERMGVLRRLNKKQRYFFSRRDYSAFSFPGGIAFGKWYWDSLDDGERMAIAAHEFSHIRSNDGVRRFLRIALPSLVVTLAIMIAVSSELPYSASAAVLEGAGVGIGTVLVFALSFTLLSLINAPWRRRTELDCDADAAKYANGEDLIRALSFWESAISEKARKTMRYRILSRYYPTLAQRTERIRATIGKSAEA
jgi:Zn-dependent protease with chaperone function